MSNPTGKYQRINQALNELYGIMAGISADSIINEQELQGLTKWLNENKDIQTHAYGKALVQYIKYALEDGLISGEEYEDIMYQIDAFTVENPFFTEISTALQTLNGFLKGIAIDRVISEDEIRSLDNWLEANEYLKGVFPYDEIYQAVTNILQDGIIDDKESHELVALIDTITGISTESDNASLVELLLEKNIYHIDPYISFEQKNFVITGVSERYKRREIIEKINTKGGSIKSKVSNKVDYLIICADKSQHWAFSSFGNKIKDTMFLRKSGANIIIVHEFDLYDHF